MLSDALKTDIPSSRSLTYRRNVLAVGSVLALLLWYPDINLGDLSFFGVKPPSRSDSRALVLGVVWALLLFHLASFLYHAWRDWLRWLKIALATSSDMDVTKGFPELGMFFGRGPRSDVYRALADGYAPADWNAKLSDNKRDLLWMPADIDEAKKKSRRIHSFKASRNDIKRLREDVCWFFAIDVGVPTFAFAICLLLSIGNA